MIDGFKDGIVNAFNNAVNAVKNGLSRIRNFFPFSPAKEGPFSGKGYTIYSGQALTEDFAKGMSMAESDVVRQAEAITKAAAFDVPTGAGNVRPEHGRRKRCRRSSGIGRDEQLHGREPRRRTDQRNSTQGFGLHRREHLRGVTCTRSTEFPSLIRKRRWSVHRESQRRTPVAFRSVDVDVPGVDGNIPIYGEQVEATALALELNVYGTPGQIEERVNFLRSLLGRTSGPIEVEKRGGLVADAKPASISDPVMTEHYARVGVTLSIPCWRVARPIEDMGTPRRTDHRCRRRGHARRGKSAHRRQPRPHHRPSHDTAKSRMSRPARRFEYTGSVPAGQKLLIDTSRWRATLGAESVLGIDRDERHGQHCRHRPTLRHHAIPTYADTWAQPGRRSHHRALR